MTYVMVIYKNTEEFPLALVRYPVDGALYICTQVYIVRPQCGTLLCELHKEIRKTVCIIVRS